MYIDSVKLVACIVNLLDATGFYRERERTLCDRQEMA